MLSKRASLVVGQDARAHARSHTDRQVARGSADAVAAICEREPWRHCGKPGRSIERPMSTPRYAGVPRKRPAAQRQDKSTQGARGRLGQETPANSNDAANIARYRHNLPFSPMRRRYKALGHLAVSKIDSAANFHTDPGRSLRHQHRCARAKRVAMIAWRQSRRLSVSPSRLALLATAPPACGLDRLPTNRLSSPRARSSRSVVSGIFDSGPVSGSGNLDANDPKRSIPLLSFFAAVLE